MNGQTGKLYSIVVPNNISQTTINMEKENILYKDFQAFLEVSRGKKM